MSTLTDDIINAVYTSISDFNDSYARMIHAPRENWASMMEDAFGMIMNHNIELLRLAQIASESTNRLPYPVVPETFTMAINAGSNVHLKSQRYEVFKAICQQMTRPSEASKKTRIPTYTLTEQDLHELSYIVPGQHGWILVYQGSELQRFLGNTDRFCLELQIPGSAEIPYGEYGAKIIPGQAMSGVEFSQLSEMTRNNLANSICAARGGKEGVPEFRTIMEDLLHSRITLTCVFLECIKGPTTEPCTSTLPPPTSNLIKPIKPVSHMESSMLPFRDPTLDLAPRLIRTESDGFELIDDSLINFPSISRRKHPFGAIGDSRQSPFTTSTPNVSVRDSEADGAGSEARKPLSELSFSQFSFSESSHEEGYVSRKNASFNGHEPLKAIQLNGRSSSPFERIPSMASSLPLPYKSCLNNSECAEYSFSVDQDTHSGRFSLGMPSCYDYEYTDDPENNSDPVILEQQNRPSSALAATPSGGQPIWESCRLRKMCSAPSIPREIEVQNANANATFSGVVTSLDGVRETKEVKLFW